MATFWVETLSPAPHLRAEHGVLRAASLAVTSDARAAADRIIGDARAEADMLLQRAHQEAKHVVHEAEQQTLQRAIQLLRTLEHTNATLLDRSQDIVVSLAQSVFDRLVIDTTPRERVQAMLRRVLHEAQPRLANPLLRLHPDDIEHAPALEWEIKPDPSLSPGMCRLEATDGEWSADFSAAVAALKSALARTAAAPAMSVGDGERCGAGAPRDSDG